MSRADASEEARVVAGSAGHGHAQDLSLPGAVAGEQQQPPPPGRQASALMGLQNQCVPRSVLPRGGFALMAVLPQRRHLLHEFPHPGLLHAARISTWLVFYRSRRAGHPPGAYRSASALPASPLPLHPPHGRRPAQLEGPDGGISPGHRPRKIPLELQRLFAELQLLDQVLHAFLPRQRCRRRPPSLPRVRSHRTLCPPAASRRTASAGAGRTRPCSTTCR